MTIHQRTASPLELKFSGYQKFVVVVLAFLQFTIVLDFMLLAPLGALVIPALKITTAQFGLIVSAYALSAGVSGLLTAGFADRFDRKKLLLFFYAAFCSARCLRTGLELSLAAARKDGHRRVRGRRRLGGLRDRHRPVPAADARPRHGSAANGVRRQQRSGHPVRPLAVESLGLERAVLHDRRRLVRWSAW